MVTDGWLEFLKTPSEEGFVRLHSAHCDLVYTICRRVLQDAEAAADASQGAWLRLVAEVRAGGRGAFVGRAPADVMARLAVLEADRLRKQRDRRHAREVAMEFLPEVPAGDESARQVAAAAELRARLEAIVEELPEEQRLAIQLHYFHGLTHQAIAAAQGVPLGTVATRIRDARRRLEPMCRAAGITEVGAALATVAVVAGLWTVPPGLAAAAPGLWKMAMAGGAAAAAVGATGIPPALRGPAAGGGGLFGLPSSFLAPLLGIAIVVPLVIWWALSTGKAPAPPPPPGPSIAVAAAAPPPTLSPTPAPTAEPPAPTAAPATVAPTPAVAEIPPPRVVVRGVVVAAAGGEPIAGAAIRATTMQMLTGDEAPMEHVELTRTTTAADGTFRVVAPSSPFVAIWAEVPGYAWGYVMLADMAAIQGAGESKPETEHEVTLRLEPAAPLTVTVVDEGGAPVGGVAVTHLRRLGREAGMNDMGFIARVPTDTAGIAPFPFLAEGEGRLLIVADGFLNLAIDRPAGQDAVEAVLRRGGATVRGRTIDANTGEPVPFAEVRLLGSGGGFEDEEAQYATYRRAFADVDGRFAISAVSEGDQRAIILAPRYATVIRQEPIQIVAGSDPPEVTIELSPSAGMVVSGIVTHAETGAPIEGVRVRINPALSRLFPSQSEGDATTDAEGRYSLPFVMPVAPEEGMLLVEHEGLEIVEQGACGAEPSATKGSHVYNFRLGPATTPIVLTGRVLDILGEPMAGLDLRIDGYRGGSFSTSIDEIDRQNVLAPRTDAKGAFAFRVVANTTYQIKASQGGKLVAWSAPIEVGESTPAPVDVRQPGEATLLVRVVDGEGTPIEGAAIAVQRLMPMGRGTRIEPVGAGVTNNAGEYRLGPFPASSLRVGAHRGGMVPHDSQLMAAAGEESRLEVVLQPDAGLRGVVVDGAGVPVPDANVEVRNELDYTRHTTVTTDAAGVFNAPTMGASNVQLTATTEAQVGTARVRLPAEGPITIVVGERQPVVVAVIDEATGDPVAGATARVSWPKDIKVTSPEPGVFNLEGLTPPQSATVEIRAPGYPMLRRSIIVGESNEPDVKVFEMGRGVRVEGTVLDENGRPVAGATVVLGAPPFQRTDSTETNNDGSFAYENLHPANYNLTVEHPRGMATHSFTVEGTETMKVGGLVLEAGKRSLRGRVVDAAGRALAGVAVSVSSYRRMTAPDTGAVSTRSNVRNAVTDAEGRFVVTGLDAHGLTASLSLGKRRWEFEDNDPLAGEVELRLGRGTLTGLVSRNGTPANAQLDIRDAAKRTVAMVGTDGNGRYRVEQLEAGIYRVVAYREDGTTLATAEAQVPEQGEAVVNVALDP